MDSDAAPSVLDPIEKLTEEYLKRLRRGERPTPADYAARYPQLAGRILALFPALELLEGLKSTPEDHTVPRDDAAAGIESAGGRRGAQRLGDYTLLRELGRGGMGIVYEAEHESLKNRVALKVMHPRFRAERTYLRRFQTEARSAARLHHTNIVSVFDFGEQGGVCYFAMQYIDGVGLDRVLDDVRRLRARGDGASQAATAGKGEYHATEPVGGPLSAVSRGLLTGRYATAPATPGRSDPDATVSRDAGRPDQAAFVVVPERPPPEHSAAESTGSSSSSSLAGQPEAAYFREIARLGAQVADALDYAHRQNVVHRDIKPSNLLLDAYGNAWVTDFGLAKLVEGDDLSGSHDLAGTLRFMAPERFRGVTDRRVDIYALGATLYEMLTLRPAFAERDQIQLIDQITHQPPPPLRQHDPRIPRDLETIVLKTLSKDPADRCETAGELRDELRRFLEGRPTRWRRVGPAEHLRRWSKRNPWLAGAAGTVAAALVAVAVLAVLYADRQRHFALAKADATQKITALAGNLATSLAKSNRLLAIRNFDRGQTAFEKGKIGPGMLWMIECWRSAVEAGDRPWQHAARANLGAWVPHYGRLKAVLSHPSPVVAATFSPDGRAVISGSEDRTARLWNAATGRPIGQPMRHQDNVVAVAFSPDGKTALTGSEDKTARFWDARTGAPLGLPLQHKGAVPAVVFHPNGKIVLTGSTDNTARLWDTATGQLVGPSLRHQGAITAVAFSPDGKTIITSSQDGTARLWDTATGKGIGSPLEHGGVAVVVAFNPDGKRVFTFTPFTPSSQGKVWNWDAVTGKPLGSFQIDSLLGGPGSGMAVLSPDGKSCVWGGPDRAQLWDVVTGKPFGLPLQHESNVRAIAFSPDGKTILTGSRDREARLWDAATGQLLGLLEHQGPVVAVAFNPDGKTLLTASEDGTVRLWDANPVKPVGQVLEFPCTDSYLQMLDQEGKVFVSFPRERNYQRYLQLWDAATRHPIGAPLPQPGGNAEVIFNPEDKTILTIEVDKTTRRWDTTTGTDLGPLPHFPFAVTIEGKELSPDGKTLLIGWRDGTAWIWDIALGAVRSRKPVVLGSVDAVAFSPDGKTLLTGLATGEAQLWDAATFTPVSKPFPHPGAIGRVRFSPDGKSILVSGEDGTARLWDLATGTRLLPPFSHEGHGGWIYGLAFSPDGKTIATGSNDKTSRLWDTATGQPIGPALRHKLAVNIVGFPADGKSLFTGSDAFRRFRLPPDLPDDLDRVAAWVEVVTGLTLERQQGLIQVLDNAAWLEARDRLESLGGPPEAGPDQRLDPILHGPDPTARARSFIDRKQWAAADAEFAAAIAARPASMAILIERGDLCAHRGLWKEAAAYYAAMVQHHPRVAPLHEHLAISRLLAGDLPGYRASCAGMLEQFKPLDDSIAARRVAYACSLAPGAVSDLKGLIQVSERSTRWDAENARVVGAVLFRAGHLEEALRRFGKVPKTFQPRAWDSLFLAMIHGRLGHAEEAVSMLEKADRWIAEADKAPSGTEKEGARWIDLTERPTILLLRGEAEAVVRFDPVFPADPFAD